MTNKLGDLVTVVTKSGNIIHGQITRVYKSGQFQITASDLFKVKVTSNQIIK